jgi:hypothetical protein
VPNIVVVLENDAAMMDMERERIKAERETKDELKLVLDQRAELQRQR